MYDWLPYGSRSFPSKRRRTVRTAESFQRTVQFLPNLFRFQLAMLPDESHDGAFQFTEVRRIVTLGSVTCHNVTHCSTRA